jgi:hypothetical protein
VTDPLPSERHRSHQEVRSINLASPVVSHGCIHACTTVKSCMTSCFTFRRSFVAEALKRVHSPQSTGARTQRTSPKRISGVRNPFPRPNIDAVKNRYGDSRMSCFSSDHPCQAVRFSCDRRRAANLHFRPAGSPRCSESSPQATMRWLKARQLV